MIVQYIAEGDKEAKAQATAEIGGAAMEEDVHVAMAEGKKAEGVLEHNETSSSSPATAQEDD